MVEVGTNLDSFVSLAVSLPYSGSPLFSMCHRFYNLYILFVSILFHLTFSRVPTIVPNLVFQMFCSLYYCCFFCGFYLYIFSSFSEFCQLGFYVLLFFDLFFFLKRVCIFIKILYVCILSGTEGLVIDSNLLILHVFLSLVVVFTSGNPF